MLVAALKLVGVLLLVVVVFVAAGVTGLLFTIWPTYWPDTALSVTTDRIEKLRSLRAAPKFYQDDAIFYPGAASEERRVTAEALVNDLLDSIVCGLEAQPRKSFILREFKLTMRAFPTDDTEDMDRLCGYLEQVMDTLGIEGSNELLNVWRYGFPYGWVLRLAA